MDLILFDSLREENSCTHHEKWNWFIVIIIIIVFIFSQDTQITVVFFSGVLQL